MENGEERSGAQSRVADATSTGENVEETELEDQQTEPTPSPSALNMCWSFGINREVPTINLSDGERKIAFYVTSHTGVMYDFKANKQKLLQGHCNAIACSCASEDRRWIATADNGPNSMVIIWDSFTGIPVQTIFDPHPSGCIAIAMSPDAKYITTISNTLPQVVSVWDWTTNGETPMCSTTLDGDFGMQTYVLFNPDDTSQLVSNSTSQVIFYSLVDDKLEFIAPPLTDKDFNRSVGLYSQSVFQKKSARALTATSCGNIIVWEYTGKELACNRKAFKIVKLQEKALTVLTTIDKFIVTGDVAGHVRFLDQQLRLSNWYKHFEAGPVNSVSFSYQPKVPTSEISIRGSAFAASSTLDASPFVVNDFIVSSTSANVVFYSPASHSLEWVCQEHDRPVRAISCHPSQTQICIGGYSGTILLWDYQEKKLITRRTFDKMQVNCITFNPTGDLIALGFTNGCVRIIDAVTLLDEGKDEGIAEFNHCHDSVTHIKFSHNSQYLATADLDRCVTIFKHQPENDEEPWMYMGKQRAHYRKIQDIEFGIELDSDIPRLLSIGQDRVLVEYDLMASSTDDVRLLSNERIEQSAVPQCFSWYPPIVKENFLVVVNDQFKMKLYNSTTKMCRKTVLGPTYGTPLKKIIMFPAYEDRETRFMAYITTDKIGLQMLPLDGNPHKAMALIAHPDGVSNLCSSYDGKYVFTAGEEDNCVLMWKVNPDALEAAARLGGEDLIPFYGLMEGGREGELFAELEDYFYYAQIRDQSVDTTETRQVSTKVPLNQVPYLVRALGFYPSEQEVEDMINEVKFSNYVETGTYVTHIDLGDFIKLYVNHRPAFGLSSADLHEAFTKLGEPGDQGFQVSRDVLLDMLKNRGEHLTEAELAEYMSTLMGQGDLGGSAETGTFDASGASELLREHLSENFTAESFAAHVIGFSLEATS